MRKDKIITTLVAGTIVYEAAIGHEGEPHIEVHAPGAPIGWAATAPTTTSSGPSMLMSDFIKSL